ncbi:MAG: type II toxin-antitoxin system HicB family antitoxin [Methanobacteriaceae archaeon]|nr:type II toxin-antitoxin system HicB family antitoxin [Methanobacteriaceae archaeon]MDP2836063.1 type II toxin-antitoxin system HicB family antitoxin [Methanobacteriaceae archaeon]MDP3035493.1 type II toxin-antitoxin system HicB family antitoxin [Methanobacteriaceae archaeon]MDP3485426.1 type II toxin-antitoxin system HicB family antitoxin [Methanobacteriaceae archaeon]MDP3623129.1 type II toxin-antitoxin system HicB family antitoxin [Methanobacteriaceae archaeon]
MSNIVKLELPISITEEDGTYVAVCKLFHVASQGRTENEAIDNIREALELFLEDEDVQEQFKDIIISCGSQKEEIVSVKFARKTSFGFGPQGVPSS